MGFLEVPIFSGGDGVDLQYWIFSLEFQFIRYKFTDLEKLNLAQSTLHGKASNWFSHRQWLLPFRSWTDLKNNLVMMFGDDLCSTGTPNECRPPYPYLFGDRYFMGTPQKRPQTYPVR